MNIVKILTPILISLLGYLTLTAPTQALPVDFIDNGSYTTDTIANLDWLDLTVTHGISRDDVLAQLGTGGTYDGWRYATLTEFFTLNSNWTGLDILGIGLPDEFMPGNVITGTEYGYIITGIEVPDQGVPGTSHGLVDLLGITLENQEIGVTLSYGYLIALGYQSGIGIADIHKDDNQEHIIGSLFTLNLIHASFAGSYLVRNTQISVIPLPASIWMFASVLCGMGLIGWIRNKRMLY